MRVAAVIVHWRHLDDTLACLASVAAEPGVDVVVVDNGSSDRIVDVVGGRATCVRSEVNLGYAGGANLGIRAALAAGADVVLLLNDDVRVVRGATAAAVRRLAEDGRVAAVGPKVLAREDPSRLWLAWGDVTWQQSLVALHGSGEKDGPRFAQSRPVDWIAGCAMWLRRAALEELGLLDETFFAYHEEVDWCARARAGGWRVVYEPAAVVTHTGRGASGGEASVRIRKYFAARNTVLFARKHATVAQRLKLACFLAGSLPLQLAWQWPRGGAAGVWLKIRGIRDALANRRPPFEALGLR